MNQIARIENIRPPPSPLLVLSSLDRFHALCKNIWYHWPVGLWIFLFCLTEACSTPLRTAEFTGFYWVVTSIIVWVGAFTIPTLVCYFVWLDRLELAAEDERLRAEHKRLCASFEEWVGISRGPKMPESVLPSTELHIYGLYKVATIGNKPTGPAPGFFSLDFDGKAKYNAWEAAGSEGTKTKDAAMREYINLIRMLSNTPDATRKSPTNGSEGAGWASTIAGCIRETAPVVIMAAVAITAEVVAESFVDTNKAGDRARMKKDAGRMKYVDDYEDLTKTGRAPGDEARWRRNKIVHEKGC